MNFNVVFFGIVVLVFKIAEKTCIKKKNILQENQRYIFKQVDIKENSKNYWQIQNFSFVFWMKITSSEVNFFYVKKLVNKKLIKRHIIKF